MIGRKERERNRKDEFSSFCILYSWKSHLTPLPNLEINLESKTDDIIKQKYRLLAERSNFQGAHWKSEMQL
jgi:hypothetical protein